MKNIGDFYLKIFSFLEVKFSIYLNRRVFVMHTKWLQYLCILLNIYSRLSLSRIPRDSLKYFEITVHQHIRFAEFRKKMNRTANFNKCICNLTPEIRDILKILWKRGEIAP